MKRTSIIAAALVLLITFGLVVGYGGVTGQSPAIGQKLVGTWGVTLRFPVCSSACPCPGGVPNIPIPVLQTYSSDRTMTEVSGGTLFRSAALGSWEHARDQEYLARYAFFIFNADGTRRAKEVVTSQIQLQDQDAFEATASADLFAPDGTPLGTGCPINITGTRF
jgi:hypothetical protein